MSWIRSLLLWNWEAQDDFRRQCKLTLRDNAHPTAISYQMKRGFIRLKIGVSRGFSFYETEKPRMTLDSNIRTVSWSRRRRRQHPISYQQSNERVFMRFAMVSWGSGFIFYEIGKPDYCRREKGIQNVKVEVEGQRNIVHVEMFNQQPATSNQDLLIMQASQKKEECF